MQTPIKVSLTKVVPREIKLNFIARIILRVQIIFMMAMEFACQGFNKIGISVNLINVLLFKLIQLGIAEEPSLFRQLKSYRLIT